MDLGISGRVALVTASSKGLGKGAAKALAAEGCRVVICARGADALRQAEQDVAAGAAGGADAVHSIVADVTEPAAPAQLVAETLDHFGSIDIVVANAGGPPPKRALDVTDDDIDWAINANMSTSIRLAREAVPHMRERHWGRIVFITSSSIKEPIPSLAMSNVARTGLWAWAKTAARDLAAEGITVNLACPGAHNTDRMKALAASGSLRGPLGDPDDFGRVVAFLCSESAGFVSGTALQVDGAAIAGLL